MEEFKLFQKRSPTTTSKETSEEFPISRPPRPAKK